MNTNEVKEKLLAEITKTEKAIQNYRELTKPEAPDVAIGRISRMDAINNRAVMEAALLQAEDKLAKLHSVFDKLGSPDFGICIKCRNPIPIGRILIRPESLYCVNCAK